MDVESYHRFLNSSPKISARNHPNNEMTVQNDSSMENFATASSSSSEPCSSISADQLAKLLRGGDREIFVLDCRSNDDYHRGHCAQAKRISPPPSLIFNRNKTKPSFWNNYRREILNDANDDDAVAETEENRGKSIVLIDDEQQLQLRSINGIDENIGRTTTCQPFSNFVLNKLQNEGYTTYLLEKGAMSTFVSDYPDLCVFNNDDQQQQPNLPAVQLQLGPLSPSNHHQMDERSNSMTTPSACSSLLAKRQQSKNKQFVPPRLENLSLNHTCVDSNNVSSSSNATIRDDLVDAQSSSNNHRWDNLEEQKEPVEIFEESGGKLYLGNWGNAKNLDTLRKYNIRYILNVTKDLPNKFEDYEEMIDGQCFKVKYLKIPIVDNSSQDLLDYFPTANAFIAEALGSKCGVLAHCRAGISRSVIFTMAYLVQAQRCSVDDAFEIVKQLKGNINPNCLFMRELEKYQEQLSKSWSTSTTTSSSSTSSSPHQLVESSSIVARDSIGGDLTPDSAVSSLSTSSSSSACVDAILARGQHQHGDDDEPLIRLYSDSSDSVTP